MASNIVNVKKLQKAINLKGHKILYNTTQWYSEDEDRPITVYHIKKAIWNNDKKKTENKELFKSTSLIQIVLFLRDYWYEINGKPIPQDNVEWNKIKENYKNNSL